MLLYENINGHLKNYMCRYQVMFGRKCPHICPISISGHIKLYKTIYGHVKKLYEAIYDLKNLYSHI